MADGWYYMRGDQPVGPVSHAQLTAELLQSPYWHKEYVWKPGYSAWQQAGSVDELSSAMAQAQLEQLEQLEQRPPRSSRKASVLIMSLVYAALAILGILGGIIYHALS